MSEAHELTPLPDRPQQPGCARCGGPVDVRTRHLQIDGSVVRAYCSSDCATAQLELLPADELPERRRRGRWYAGFRLALALPALLLLSPHEPPAPPPPAAVAQPEVAAPVVVPEAPQFGPAWPPTEQDWIGQIAGDAWIHPLDGPVRRMPIRDGRVFGAERPGDRPAECRAGHCGVDVGGETWGEPVHAAHDGVVDRVQRGPNEEHGGLYVRLSHRDGTIFTEYFHLAAIPRWIVPGLKVKVGDVIGLLGDSGVKHSGPHLHFTVSVRPSAQLPEQYIDPEPLIALWPLRLQGGGLTAQAAPGVPLGAHHHHKRRKLAAAPSGLDEILSNDASGGAD